MADYGQDRYGQSPVDYGRQPSGQYQYGGAPSENYGPSPQDGGGYGPGPDQAYGGQPYSGSQDQRATSHSQYEYDPSAVGNPELAALGADDEAFKQYTERRAMGSSIDPENGIAPRRCTDCVCLFVFVGYVLGMIICVSWCRNSMVGDRQWSDLNRLTHGHDYAGRLCGVDKMVASKPFLFWCRKSYNESTATPTSLNIPYPTCVSTCPTANDTTATVKCLFNKTVNQQSFLPTENDAGAPLPFGTIETYHIQYQQSEAETHLYETVTFGGRFCVPKDIEKRNEIIGGPMRLTRFLVSAGSLQNPWLVLFGAAVLAVVLGYAYLFLIHSCPRITVALVLYSTFIVATLGGVFFLYGTVSLVADHTQNAELLTAMHWKHYKEYNPFFETHTDQTATIISVVVGVVMLFCGCGVLGVITHIAGDGFGYVVDLVEAATEALQAMPAMVFPPAGQALAKFILMWLCGSNFAYLCAVGVYDDKRLVVNGQRYKDQSAVYEFDWSILPYMVLYLYGWVWLVELVTSVGQFFVSYATISWYFIKKEGFTKPCVPPNPPMHATFHIVHSHAGSLCLGAAIIPWIRLIRIFNWVEDESVPNEDAACCPDEEGEGNCCTHCLNAICKCVGGLCAKVTSCRKRLCSPECCVVPKPEKTIREGYVNEGCAYRYTKNSYNDVIIRSQHFLHASSRALRLINNNNKTREFLLNNEGCQVITAVGVVSVGLICAMVTHLIIMSSSVFTHPDSNQFIAEPFAVDILAFLLCGGIAYDIIALVEHTADTLMYCFAWNKKYASDSNGVPVEEYLPESLRQVCGVDDEEEDDDREQLYGVAAPTMYLKTYMGASKQEQQAQKMQARALQSALQMSAMGGSPNMSARSGSSRQLPFGSQVPYQALSQAGIP